ncbi:glutamine-hydrolyzing GMP synthase [Salmonella enterica subsp. enterica serovar Montevideo]
MTENIHKHRILILDFGSQYTQLVARRVRELGVYCELWAWDVTEAQIRDFNPSGIILSGGPESTTEENSPRAPQYVFEAGVPVFGVCYGMQTMAMQRRKSVSCPRFLSALAGENDPEAKRKIIGRVFVEVFDEEALKLEDVKWLAQGTIYPDVIESAASATGKAHVIKSHHNVGGLPKEMKMGLVEPLKELFKDEVRKIGLELGLPYDMLYRHPFPGPGLGVRVLGEVKKEYCDLLRRADAIFIEELRKADLYDKVSQAFTVFLPVRSVGVMGDGRKYDWVVSLRAVETIDFMTAHWAHLPYDFLGRVSNRIINEVNGISRVVYDISGKPPATIEWE